MITLAEYDQLQHTKHFIESVSRGISDADKGNYFGTDQLLEELDRRRKYRENS